MRSMRRIGKPAILATLALLLAGEVVEAEMIFFGEDVNRREEGTDNSDTIRIARPNAEAAHANFLARLEGVGVETFESFAPNSNPPTLTFGATAASLSPPLRVMNLPTGTFGGAYPTSGDQMLFMAVGAPDSFRITFDSPQDAFGFFATDAEVPGNLRLQFLLADGVTTINRNVPLQAGAGGLNQTGSVLFYGRIDASNPFLRVTILRPLNPNDGIGFDDFTIGASKSVPEPASLVLLVSSAIGILPMLRRRGTK